MAKQKRFSGIVVNPNEVYIVGLDTEDDDTHPLYDDRINLPLIDEHVESAKQFGISEPIHVSKAPDGDYLVVSGRQRVRCARAAGLTEIPALVVKGPKGRKAKTVDLLLEKVRENMLRQDLKPIEKAKLAQELAEAGMSKKDIAAAMGVTTESVKQWEKVLNMDPAVVKAPEKQKEKLEKILKEPANNRKGEPSTPQKRKRKRKKNMNKALARFMANDEENALEEKAHLILQWAHGLATAAECERKIKGFKASLRRARKALGRTDDE